jgi:YVTN family beta-propeller protein
VGPTAYVVDQKGNTVTPISVAIDTAGSPISVGADPSAIAITPDGGTAYVTDRGSDSVTVIDTAYNSVRSNIVVGSQPDGIAITRTGRRPTGRRERRYGDRDQRREQRRRDADHRRRGTNQHRHHPQWGHRIRDQQRVGHGHTHRHRQQHRRRSNQREFSTDGDRHHARWRHGRRRQPRIGHGHADRYRERHGRSADRRRYRTKRDRHHSRRAPIASFTVRSGTIHDKCGFFGLFYAGASVAQGAPIAEYAWSFGDGSSVVTTSPSIAHFYSAGRYAVALTETDADGTYTTRMFTGQTLRGGRAFVRACNARRCTGRCRRRLRLVSTG